MTGKDVKDEARKKLALNMHQAIVIYTVEFTIFITLIALVVMACVALNSISFIASVVMICYGSLLLIIAIVASGMINFAMTDFYLVSYKCKPYNVRRLGETIAQSNITKILLLSVKRTVIGFLLLLCLIVPGVIYLIRTSMAYYLLIANPKMKPSTALTASNKIMSGKTGPYFSLCMSLLGWYILGILSLGLGFIFISPYVNLVKTVFYKRNLQGDKNTYDANRQAAGTAQYATSAPMPNTQPQAQQQYSGPAPIDTLEDEDVLDMNAAIQDFGGAAEAVPDVPEVPLAPPTKKKEKTKLTREEKRQAKTAEHAKAKEHKIDGTGIVETERILTTQELSDSELMQRDALERMYSNSERQKPKINYFAMDGNSNSSDFEDDFGVEPVAAEPEEAVVQQIPDIEVTPVQQTIEPEIEPEVVSSEQQPVQENVEPIISDSEFDEFLRNFDDATETMVESDEAPTETPVAEPEEAHAMEGRVIRAVDRRKEAEERIERDRRAAAERIAQSRGGATPDRTERLRRERDQRLQNHPPKK